MRNLVYRFMENRIILFIATGMFFAYLLSMMWPASWWLRVDSIRIFDSAFGEPVVMAVDRTIERDFRGTWLASIRRFENGGWVSYCAAAGATNYITDSKFPDPLTLKWWTAPGCHTLETGKYIMRTTWTVTGDAAFLPSKTVTKDSNIFQVTE